MPRRREGPVRNRVSKVFFFDEYIGFSERKKRVRFTLRTRDPKQARYLWKHEHDRLWDEYYGVISPQRPQKRHFAEVAAEYIDYARNIKKVKEWRTIESRLQVAADCWGDIFLDEISSDQLVQLDAYLRNKKPPRSPKTINHYMGTLKALFYFAIRKKYYSGENPIKEVKPYVVDEKRREFSSEEISRILDAAERVEKEAWPHTMLQKYAKRIVLLLLFTGMRIGELLNLKWENIRGDKIILKRTETKQKKDKVIPLTEGIRGVLESLKDKEGAGIYVIPRRRDQVFSSRMSAKTVLNKIRKLSGIEDFDFHGLRHTASTIMVSQALGKGVGLADIMKILGHSKVETTMKYLHADFDRMKKAVEILEKFSIIPNEKTEEEEE